MISVWLNSVTYTVDKWLSPFVLPDGDFATKKAPKSQSCSNSTKYHADNTSTTHTVTKVYFSSKKSGRITENENQQKKFEQKNIFFEINFFLSKSRALPQCVTYQKSSFYLILSRSRISRSRRSEKRKENIKNSDCCSKGLPLQ